jgi:hypothetical protein
MHNKPKFGAGTQEPWGNWGWHGEEGLDVGWGGVALRRQSQIFTK